MRNSRARAGTPTPPLESLEREDLSDLERIRQVSSVVARPRVGQPNSFVLHAPLELTARASLLALARPGMRAAIRDRIASIADEYESFGPARPEPSEASPSTASRSRSGTAATPEALLQAVVEGDPDRAEAEVLACSGHVAATEIARALTEPVLSMQAAAAHAPILLGDLERDQTGLFPLDLLRPAVRLLANRDFARIDWFEDLDLDRPANASRLESALWNIERLGPPEEGNIPAHLARAAEALRHEGPVVEALGEPDRAAWLAVLRVAARSMVFEGAAQAPYLWSHCLTLPLSVMRLAHHCRDQARALAIAATHVVSYRTCHAKGEPQPSDRFESAATVDLARWSDLIDEAGAHRDAHVAKYANACLQAAAIDPEQSGLYLAAGERLLAVWRAKDADGIPPGAR